MPHPDWEDLSEFFDPADFATSVELWRGEEKLGEVLGIFDDPSSVHGLGDYELESSSPRVVIKEVEDPGVARGDTAVIEGVSLDIMGAAIKDGTGVATIELAPPSPVYNAEL